MSWWDDDDDDDGDDNVNFPNERILQTFVSRWQDLVERSKVLYKSLYVH